MSIILITLIGAVAAHLLGWAWHSPLLFGRKYASSVGFTMGDNAPQMSKSSMAWHMGFNFIALLAYAFVLFNLLGAFGAITVGTAFHTALIVFFGFIVPTFGISILWNGRTTKQRITNFVISFGYQAVVLIIWSFLFAWLA